MTAPLPYELALELQQAGWPQPPFPTPILGKLNGEWVYDPLFFPLKSLPSTTADRAYSPSLDELIEACPRNMKSALWNMGGPDRFVLREAIDHWIAGYERQDGQLELHATGTTRSEAATRLWLALKKEGKV